MNISNHTKRFLEKIKIPFDLIIIVSQYLNCNNNYNIQNEYQRDIIKFVYYFVPPFEQKSLSLLLLPYRLDMN